MMYLGDFDLSKTIRFGWNSNAIAGESITRATNGTISVYKDGGTTQSTTGVTDTEDFDSLTGVHLVAIDTSADGTFYSSGSEFMVVLSAASIDGKTINSVLAHFSLLNRSHLRPTTAGRTLDVSAGGEAGLDWANIGSPTTTVGLSGTTVKTATDVETDTADIQTRLPAALVGGRIDADMGAISTDATAANNAESFFDGTGYAGTNNVIPLVTTVTNLTNAPTSGDLTATMKTSVTTAATAATPTAQAVTGNVGGNVTGSVGSVATGGITALSIATGAIDADAIATDAANEIADALLDRSSGVETGYTPRQALRLILSALAAKLSGAATTSIAIRDVGDTKDRITATVDANGNRTAVTLDAS